MVPLASVYDPQYDVREFMETFGQEVPVKPTLPDEKTRVLRARLIYEEAMETVRALGCDLVARGHDGEDVSASFSIEAGDHPVDMVGIADGCADILVVTHGCALACGIDIYPVFNEVHRSNMSKLWTNEETGEKEVRKREDGKVLKSPDYSPADVKGELFKQHWEEWTSV
jgi:predicted HAD superfamily Cof-like phosphohydrolase